ncbi:MAG TPA: sulfite exporter TauE/SafE family protein [Methylomirabilota bacterium]|nr:sulfite exporter TauE/SafE family protein [Methylomirabilota bacterium]
MIPGMMAAVVLAAAFIKGAIGFGFPSLATPLLSLFVNVKTAVVVLILPNIVMDGIQFVRRGTPLAIARRFGFLLAAGAVGMVLGTRVLTLLSPKAATLVLGIFVLVFVTLNVTGLAPKIPARWEPWLSAPAGFVAGLIGGVTNSPATALVLYFHGVGLSKDEFIPSVAFAFFFYKLVQLGAVTWYGLLPWSLLWISVALTAVSLAGFAAGLRVQDRLDQRTFNRAVLAFLAVLGAWLMWSGLR